MIAVALFPIPGSVCFPWIACPLHVFEPRYRQMVRHCIDNQMLMGICHTQKVVHAGSQQQTLQEALNSNQATYKPCTIFSAGPVELLEELEDGRMLIQVDTNIRLQLVDEIQTLPFSIWNCAELPDQPGSDKELLELDLSKEKVLHRLLKLTHSSDKMQDLLNGDYWQTMPAEKFSFAVTGLLGLDPELKQDLLEMTNPQQRLGTVLELLNGIN
jgi:hypothetical protein